MKKILFITDRAEPEAAVKEALQGHLIEVVKGVGPALTSLSAASSDLIIIDYELKEKDGLQIFKQVHLIAPRVKVIMFSASNDIALAVTATKTGVSDVLRKPIGVQQLRQAVDKNLSAEESALLPPAESRWLQGESAAIKKMYADIKKALDLNYKNLLLSGEPGMNKTDVAAYIHANSHQKRRLLRRIDLSAFRREDLEATFWAGLQESMGSAAQNEEERCGTLFLDKIESLDANFRASLYRFMLERRESVDKEVLVVVDFCDREPEKFGRVEIPPLRERKEDLPSIFNFYLKQYAVKHNRPVKGFSAEVFDFLMLYNYPGNCRELECIIEQAVLVSASEMIGLKDIPLDFNWLQEVSEKEAVRSGKTDVREARQEFEKNLYSALLAKTGNNVAAAARFVDLPKTTLEKRLEELGCNPAH